LEPEQTTLHSTSGRKLDHIQLCRDENVESKSRSNGFDQWRFDPIAIPELGIHQIETKVTLLGRTFSAPIHITGMTGGVDTAKTINFRLAAAAQKFNIPMGVGSQRIAIHDPETAESFQVKNQFPDVFLIGNLGIYQLCEEDGISQALKAIESIQADALAIHVNVLQEQVQPEGDKVLIKPFAQLEQLCKLSSVPIIVKEVGCGIDPKTAAKIWNTGVSCIDLGGVGGTSWGYIEGLRSKASLHRRLGNTFRDWGIPTAEALSRNIKIFPHKSYTATGGIRSGEEVAKCVALGAKTAGIGLPLFKAALQNENALFSEVEAFIEELKITMLLTNSKKLSDLKQQIRYIGIKKS